MSVANQKIVRIHKFKYERNFLQIGIDEWQEASKSLNYSEFKLYLYLAGNADGFPLELSQKAVENATEIKKTAYHDAVKRLKELEFITEAHGNMFDFHTRAVRSSEQGKEEKEVRSSEQRNPPPRFAPAARMENEVRSSNREIDKINNKIDRIDKFLPQKENEGGAEEKAVKVYLASLSDKQKQEFDSFARGLNKSWEWIRKAIEHKKVSEWKQWGFGLLYNAGYQNQIDEIIQQEEQETAQLKAKQKRLAEVVEKQMNLEPIKFVITPKPRKSRPQIDLNSIGKDVNISS